MRARRPIIVAVASLVVLLMVAIPSQATFAKLYTLNISPAPPATVAAGANDQPFTLVLVGKSLYGVGSSVITPPSGFTDLKLVSFTSNAGGSASIVSGTIKLASMNMTLSKTATVKVTADVPLGTCGTGTTDKPWTAVTKSTSGAAFALTSPSSVVTRIALAPCAPSLTVTKAAVASPVSLGDQVAFNIQVSNAASAGTANNVVLTDTLPSGLSWSVASGGAGCTSPIVTGALSCSIGQMIAGATYSVQVTATSTQTGTITNSGASVTINGQTGPSSGSASVEVVDTDLHVTKTAVDPSVLLGDQVAFDIEVTNGSSLTAHNVGVTDTLPGGGLSWSITSGGAGCNIASGVLTCPGLTIAGNGSFAVQVGATSLASGTVTNQGASVTVNGQEVNSAPAADVNVFETTLPCGQSDTTGNVTITNPAVNGCTPAIYTATFTGTTFNIDKSGPTNLQVKVDSWAPEPAETPVPATFVWPPDPNPHKGEWCTGTPGTPDPLGPGNTLHPPGNEVWCLVSQSTTLVDNDTMQVSEIWLLIGDAALCRKSSCN